MYLSLPQRRSRDAINRVCTEGKRNEPQRHKGHEGRVKKREHIKVDDRVALLVR
ncbi:hypothetical protein NIES4071_85320 [Calothrix sp. NIES-4071]|nr:hypothetical protein NIES4071_85320 [Calothrix sp. NIES-4071]BAZ62799.1 hypothetical protein NIES4105_85250 [Calothrix sp. NIES-4105]